MVTIITDLGQPYKKKYKEKYIYIIRDYQLTCQVSLYATIILLLFKYQPNSSSSKLCVLMGNISLHAILEFFDIIKFELYKK